MPASKAVKAPFQRAAAGPLGKYTKSITPPAERRKIQAVRAERYELLSAARALFLHEGNKLGLPFPHDFHRTAKCRHVMVSGHVGVHASKQHASAFYSGLMICGSVWACPVCAAKVQERRRLEIAQAVDWAYAQGLQPMLVTFTFPHYAWQTLPDLLRQQADALQRLRAGSPWRRQKERMGYRGLIRSLELTFGANGWHPHTHELHFVGSHVEADVARLEILERWKAACIRAGLLDPSNAGQMAAFEAHAVDVKGWCSASDYLAKQDDSRHWGVDREVAKASTKAGREAGKHPFGLLAIASGYSTVTREAKGEAVAAGHRFVEYALAMKGKRQLFWSHGLRDAVGIEDKDDETVAKEQTDKADLLGLLNGLQWSLIREHGLRARVLDAAEQGGWPAVQAMLQEAIDRPLERRRGVASDSIWPVLQQASEPVFSTGRARRAMRRSAQPAQPPEP